MMELRAKAHCLLTEPMGANAIPESLPLGWRPLSPGSGFTQQETDWGFRHHAAVKESTEWRQEGCVKSRGGAACKRSS